MKLLIRFTLLIVVTLTCAMLNFAQTQTQTTQQPTTAQDTSGTSTATKANEQLVADNSKATIYFYRIKQFAGSSLEPTIYCDDKELARMDNGRFFGVKIDPGKHTFRMGDKQTGFEIDMKAGEEYYAKVTIEAGFWKGHGRLSLLQKEQGAYEMKKLKPLGVDKIKDRSLVAIYEGSDKDKQ